MFILLLLSLLGACVQPPAPDDRQRVLVVERSPELDEYAAQVVWNGTFQRWDPIPEIHVITEPDCQNDYGIYGITSSSGACVLGYAGWPGDGTHRWIVWYFWEGAYSRSALAHELNHARIGSDPDCNDLPGCREGDPDHSDTSWKTLVPEALELLESVNL